MVRDPCLLEVSNFSFFGSMSTAAAFGLVLTCCNLGLCYSAITAVLSMHYTLRRYSRLIWTQQLTVGNLL